MRISRPTKIIVSGLLFALLLWMILPELPLGRARYRWNDTSDYFLVFLLAFFASTLYVWFGSGRKGLVEKAGWILMLLLIVWAASFVYIERRRSAAAVKEIEDTVNRDLRQIDGIEQKWTIDHANASNGVPSLTEYGAMAALYKQFLRDRETFDRRSGAVTVVPEANLVYCLCYGTSNSALPADFMKVFTNLTPRVITGTNRLAFKSDGAIEERETGRHVVVLALRGLVISGDHADSSIRYIDGGLTVAQMFRFARTEGGWTYESGFSAQSGSLSRWGRSAPQ